MNTSLDRSGAARIPSPPPTLNAFSIDVEDYFHVEAFAKRISPDDWPSFTPRVEKNIDVILGMLSNHKSRATFFILGWIAELFPLLVRRIADAGHEIGCHGYAHQHIRRQTPEQFRQDIRKSCQYLTDQIQRPIRCYRAPSFSITKTTLWALDVLEEEGFSIDSSIFPVRHDLYGMPDANRFPYWIKNIFEFPPTTIRLARNNFGVAGGGYLRLLPYTFTRWAIRVINEKENQPVMVYFHPWELDPAQPRIPAPLRSRIRHYTNLSTMKHKVERLLQDFRFSTISDVCAQLGAYQAKNNPQC
jgi:polysaccharide deacetylase family protein (PEP-CTERM system associated)